MSDHPFNYRGLKITSVGIATLMLSTAPAILVSDPDLLVRVIANTGLLAGFGLAVFGAVLHWREFRKLDKERRNRPDWPN